MDHPTPTYILPVSALEGSPTPELFPGLKTAILETSDYQFLPLICKQKDTL